MERSELPMRWSEAHGVARHHSLRELWGYRELVFAFVIRDFHVRYRQTVIGVAWVVAQPLMYTLVFSGFFWLVEAKTHELRIPGVILRLSGAILWQTFAQGVQQATMCLSNNRQLITRTYFPRILLPIAAVLTPLIDFTIGWFILLFAGLAVGVTPTPWFLLTPLLAIPVTCVSFTIGVWVSMLNALYRDVTSLVPVALQLGLIVTPVMYQTTTVIPEKYRLIAALNPMVTIIDLFRAGWYGQQLPTFAMMAISIFSTAIVLGLGLRYFTRTEDIVADRV